MPSNILDTKVGLNKTPSFFAGPALGTVCPTSSILPGYRPDYLLSVCASVWPVDSWRGPAGMLICPPCRQSNLRRRLFISEPADVPVSDVRATRCIPAGILVRFTRRHGATSSSRFSRHDRNKPLRGTDRRTFWWKIIHSYRVRSHIHGCKDTLKKRSEWKPWINSTK